MKTLDNNSIRQYFNSSSDSELTASVLLIIIIVIIVTQANVQCCQVSRWYKTSTTNDNDVKRNTEAAFPVFYLE